MFSDGRDEYINQAICELIGIFGVSEEIPSDFFCSFKKQNVKECVQAIALKMGMPIMVDISYVPKGYSSDGSNVFESSELSRTDVTGRGVEGITAQVNIPEDMPLYGTSAFNGYLIKVRVSENCLDELETFVAIIAHELSHVLLKSVRHPKSNDEIYADLMPIILGFGKIVEVGRKVISYSLRGTTEVKHITTYGYFTDSEFDMVVSEIGQVVKERKNEKGLLLSKISQLKKQYDSFEADLQKLKEFIHIVDLQHKKGISKRDNIRIVQMHSLDYLASVELNVDVYKKRINDIEMRLQSLVRHTSSSTREMQEYSDTLTNIGMALYKKHQVVKNDLQTLKRNMRFLQKIKLTLLG